MNVQKDDLICGLKAIKLRDFLKKYISIYTPIHSYTMSKYFNFSEDKSNKILENLSEQGYLDRKSNNSGISYSLNTNGNALANTSFSKRIGRAKVEQFTSDIIDRASYINKSKDIFMMKINKIYLFGSCLDKSIDDYGDIDLIVDIEDNKEQEEANIKDEYKYVPPNTPYYLTWTLFEKDKLQMFIKANNHYISIHGIREFELDTDFIQIYPTDDYSKENNIAIEKGFKAIKKVVRVSKQDEVGFLYATKKNDKFSFYYNFPDDLSGLLMLSHYQDLQEEVPNAIRVLSNSETLNEVIKIEGVQNLKKKIKEASKSIKIKYIREEMLAVMLNMIEHAKDNCEEI